MPSPALHGSVCSHPSRRTAKSTSSVPQPCGSEPGMLPASCWPAEAGRAPSRCGTSSRLRTSESRRSSWLTTSRAGSEGRTAGKDPERFGAPRWEPRPELQPRGNTEFRWKGGVRWGGVTAFGTVKGWDARWGGVVGAGSSSILRGASEQLLRTMANVPGPPPCNSGREVATAVAREPGWKKNPSWRELGRGEQG